MTLFYLLKEKLGVDFAYTTDQNGEIDPNSIHIHFKNENVNVNACLERIAAEEAMAEQLSNALSGLTNETAKTQLLADKFLF